VPGSLLSFTSMPQSVSTQTRPYGVDLRLNFARWLHELAPWSLAATLTFQRNSVYGQKFNHEILLATLRHFLKLVNQRCFKQSGLKKGYSLGFAASHGLGVYGVHPHVHLSLAAPEWIPYSTLVEAVERALSRTDWISKQRKITRYRDYGWSQYLTDHGTDNIAIELLKPLHAKKIG